MTVSKSNCVWKNGEPGNVAGGYRLVSVGVLFASWWAYREGSLRFIDLRTFFAILEAESRRCVVRRGVRPRYRVEEVKDLVGIQSGGEVRRALTRLKEIGLAGFASDRVVVARDADNLAIDQTTFHERFGAIANRKRKVPVPRRTLRLLARCRRPAVVATVLGHLLRCVYAKGLKISAEGSLSSAWIAETFQVDPRNVKRARACLRQQGWLTDRPSDHWHRQRYGARVEVNLQWSEPGSRIPANLPPRVGHTARNLPPPERNRKLLEGSNNQKPTRGIGVCKDSVPRLEHVHRSDLTDLPRLLLLFTQAQRAGWIRGSEHDRLQFVAAAARALRLGTRNPGGFFVALVRGRLWHHLSASDEDTARSSLRLHLFEERHVVLPEHSSSANISASDIRLVAGLMKLATERQYAGDPFELARLHAGWTRVRWEAALRGWLSGPSRHAVHSAHREILQSLSHECAEPKSPRLPLPATPSESPLPPHGRQILAVRSSVSAFASHKERTVSSRISDAA